jgi:hypothetical protein
MSKPKVYSWCDVSHFHTSLKCLNEEGTSDSTVCDNGHVTAKEEIEFYCHICKHSEKYRLKIKLKRVEGP